MTLRHVTVEGRLDLSGMEIPFPLRFLDCVFDAPVTLDGAALYRLTLDGCRLPGLLANGLHVRRDLDLSRSRISGAHRTAASTSRAAAVWLCESEIGGRLLCVDTVIDSGGDRAVQADRMRVGGTVRLLHDFEAHGELRLLGVHIQGSLDLTGARLRRPDHGLALNLADATIGGSLFLVDTQEGRRASIDGCLNLGSARIAGQILVRNATLAPGDPLEPGRGYSSRRIGTAAISASGLFVGGDINIEGACRITGGVDLSLGDLGKLSVAKDCVLDAPGGRALDLTNAQLRSTLLLEEGTRVRGTLRLSGATVRGSLVLRDTEWREPADRSIIEAQAAVITGDVDLRGLTATGGQLQFRSASLGSGLNAAGARLENPGGRTLNLQQAYVKSSVLICEGFVSSGAVRLNRCTIEGRLDGEDAVLTCFGGHALEAISATVRGGLYLGWREVSPSVDLTGVSTSLLVDRPENWPARFVISGLTYERFDTAGSRRPGAPWDWRARCEWLGRQAAFDPGPYEQAARVFRQHGYTTEAENILIRQRRDARRATTRTPPGASVRARTRSRARSWLDGLYGLTVGYGYRPGRALWLVLVLLAVTGAALSTPPVQATMRATDARGNVYSPQGRLVTVDAAASGTAAGAREAGPTGDYATPAGDRPRMDPCGEGQVRCFSPVFYAVDTVVPLVSLEQRSTWYPDEHRPLGALVSVFLHLATLLGWLLSTVVALSFARLARTPQP
ncbi:hypothetical protein [Sphaerisporangium fuscum]|uniref:hypothetical protein n=1 Tax=Sphaerisporangium fuscum TaxID=2835868 RepID=UPI001BDC6287|nr:hypothetical protein [Sphaerisporangium fuscum]